MKVLAHKFQLPYPYSYYFRLITLGFPRVLHNFGKACIFVLLLVHPHLSQGSLGMWILSGTLHVAYRKESLSDQPYYWFPKDWEAYVLKMEASFSIFHFA